MAYSLFLLSLLLLNDTNCIQGLFKATGFDSWEGKHYLTLMNIVLGDTNH